MKRNKKWILPALLLVLVGLVYSYGSLAAYSHSFNQDSSPISSKSFTFYVNESSSQQQSLGDATLAVGQSKDYTILLDGRSSETAVDATVQLNYTYDGVWPDGLVILCDGQSVSSGYSRSFTSLESAGAAQSLTYTVIWNNPNLGNYEAFRGFVLHMSVSVDAMQPG